MSLEGCLKFFLNCSHSDPPQISPVALACELWKMQLREKKQRPLIQAVSLTIHQ